MMTIVSDVAFEANGMIHRYERVRALSVYTSLSLSLLIASCGKSSGPDEEIGGIRPEPVGVIDYHPAWSPNNDLIVFRHGPQDSFGSGITIVQTDGNNREFIVPAGEQPNWSPDGLSIVVKKFTESQFLEFELQNHLTTVIFEDSRPALYPAWHPNCDTLAFSIHIGDPEEIGIWQYSIPDSMYTRLTPTHGIDPEWHPDGNRIVFINRSTSEDRLFILDIEDGSLHDLLSSEEIGSHALWYPSFSRDGESIVFHSNETAEMEATVWLYDLMSGTIEQLVIGAKEPSLSPNGELLVFVRHYIHDPSKPGNGHLWIIDLSTKDQYQLTFPISGG